MKKQTKGIVARYRLKGGKTLLTHGEYVPSTLEIENIEEFEKQAQERFLALCKENGVSPSADTYKLLSKYDPSMQPVLEKKDGPFEKWHFLRLFCLWLEVETLRRKCKHGFSVYNACKRLTDKNKNGPWSKYTANTLRVTYEKKALSSPIVVMFLNVLADCEPKFGSKRAWETVRGASEAFISLESRERILAEADMHLKDIRHFLPKKEL